MNRDEPLRPLGLALVVSVVLWQVPYGTYPLYPFKLLGTWLHEGGHGLAMLATGVGFGRMEVFADGSGLAHAAGMAGPVAGAIIAAAGYMGAPLAGVALLAVARPAHARLGLGVLGALLAATAVASIDNHFGQVAIGATGAAVLMLAAVPRPRWHLGALNFVAAQACVGALVDIRVLYQTTLVVDGKVVGDSDAHQMAMATLGTDASWAVWLWASVWLAWSVGLLFVVLRRIGRRHRALRATVPDAPPAAPPARPGR